MSKAALKVLHEREFTISGAAWQVPGARTVLKIDKMVVKNLCAHHNSLLSVLDAEGANFMRQLLRMLGPDGKASDSGSIVFPEVDGLLAERWVAKVLSGALAGGILRQDDARYNWSPPRSWCDMLFGYTLPKGSVGLYVDLGPWKYLDGFGLQPLWRNGKEICTGGVLTLMGMRFVLMMEDGAEPWINELSTGEKAWALRRPKHLTAVRDWAEYRLPFSWGGQLHTNMGPRLVHDDAKHNRAT